LLEIVCEGTFEELDNVFADVWEEFEAVAVRGSSQLRYGINDGEGVVRERGEGGRRAESRTQSLR
jgi:hypothetical protein